MGGIGLHEVILLAARHGVLVGAAVDDRLEVEVAVARGLGAVHSSVLAFQGFRPAMGPRNMLQKKLMAKTICEATINMAHHVMKALRGWRWWNVS